MILFERVAIPSGIIFCWLAIAWIHCNVNISQKHTRFVSSTDTINGALLMYYASQICFLWPFNRPTWMSETIDSGAQTFA